MERAGAVAALLAVALLAANAAHAAGGEQGEPKPPAAASEPESPEPGAQSAEPSDKGRASESAEQAASDSASRIRLAQQHFEEALGHYRDGEYRAAAERLRRALALDPGSRDLVYNLALVTEKLGDLEGALEQFRRLQRMESDPAEMERVERAIRRLEGALRERARQTASAQKVGEPLPAIARRPLRRLGARSNQRRVATVGSSAPRQWLPWQPSLEWCWPSPRLQCTLARARAPRQRRASTSFRRAPTPRSRSPWPRTYPLGSAQRRGWQGIWRPCPPASPVPDGHGWPVPATVPRWPR